MSTLSHVILKGSTVVLKEGPRVFIPQNLHFGEIYRVEDVEIVSQETLLPQEYISYGYIPDCYKPYMIKGIGTTNHDMMGSDRFVTVRGEKYSAAWFRQATAAEVNRKARASL